MTTTATWCQTCGNPVTAGEYARCNCWCMVADALQRYLGVDFDNAAQMASDLWAQEADKERVWSAEYASDHDVETYPQPADNCTCKHGLHEIAPMRGCFHPGCKCAGNFPQEDDTR